MPARTTAVRVTCRTQGAVEDSSCSHGVVQADTIMRVADAPVKREDALWTKLLSGYCCSTCVRGGA